MLLFLASGLLTASRFILPSASVVGPFLHSDGDSNVFGYDRTYWRRLGCVTARQAQNVLQAVGGFENVDGFAGLSAEQQDAVLSRELELLGGGEVSQVWHTVCCMAASSLSLVVD